MNYGQKAWKNEQAAALKVCEQLQVPLQVMDVSNIFLGERSALISRADIPTDEVDIESHSASLKSKEKVWVANRNGVLLNVAACVAEKKQAAWIIPGFNAEEASTFPDNSVEYIEKMNACLKLSTANAVQVKCFSQDMVKEEILKDLVQLGGDIDNIWSCYYAGEKICGKCESCQRFLRARKSL